MKLSIGLAATAVSAVLLTSGATVATAAPAEAQKPGSAAQETVAPTSTALNGGDVASTQDTSQLNQVQIDNARTIIGVGKGSELTVQAQKIAIMTALQESSLRNLDSGDKDSAGLFQQRPSYGWGTHEQITDLVYSTKSFYGVNPDCPNPGLLQIDDWTTKDPGAAAQAVQGSGHPDAYDKWESLAIQLVEENQDAASIG